ncbi:MAG: flagellar biosynthesis anti-sigma factor FlgM [Deltaproteobacteria bacterium]|nr:flagellar biosynthesis anti-sigma factor FlgM [Deltaproteobacteria bacterium]
MKIYDIDREIHRCISERRLNQKKDQPTNHVRLEKVRALREEIERGAYQINYDKIAENMLCLFSNEVPGFTVTYH